MSRRGIGRPPILKGRDARRRRREKKVDPFYVSTAWRAVSAAHRAANPLCERCLAAGRITAAAHVHHKKPRRLFPEAALEAANLESICVACHALETIRERRTRGA